MRARLCAAYALNRVLISVCEIVYYRYGLVLCLKRARQSIQNMLRLNRRE